MICSLPAPLNCWPALQALGHQLLQLIGPIWQCFSLQNHAAEVADALASATSLDVIIFDVILLMYFRFRPYVKSQEVAADIRHSTLGAVLAQSHFFESGAVFSSVYTLILSSSVLI